MKAERKATFLLAAGGTGGHVTPALEAARELSARGHRCVFVGTPRGVESRLVPRAGFELELLRTGPWNEVSLARKLRTLAMAPRALLSAAAIFDRHAPAAVFSVGGYASAPTIVVALARGVPLALLEPNAMPGLANRWAGPFADWAFVGFPQAARSFQSGKCEVIGIPVREEFFRLTKSKRGEPPTLLITGGSQGAGRLNRAAAEALKIWAAAGRLRELRILHQTGTRDYEEVAEAYRIAGAQAEVRPFWDEMPRAFAQADLVVSRAGASAVGELCAAAKASILVPYPFAADQHQLRNARAMEQAGAARVELDAELDGRRLSEQVDRLFAEPGLIERMERAAAAMARPDASRRVAERMERLAGCRSG